MPWHGTQLVHSNMTKWKSPPDIAFMRKVIQESGIGVTMFARYFGIKPNTLKKSLSHGPKTARPLPAMYWHFFYEYGQHRPIEKELQKGKPKLGRPKSKTIKDPALLLLCQP